MICPAQIPTTRFWVWWEIFLTSSSQPLSMSLQKDTKPSRTPLSHGIKWRDAVIFDTCDFLPPTPMLRSRVPFFPRVMSYTESPLWLCSAGSRETRDDNFCPFLSLVKLVEGRTRGLYRFYLQVWFYKVRGKCDDGPTPRLWTSCTCKRGAQDGI